MRDGTEEGRRQDGPLEAGLADHRLLDCLPHATERREVEFVVERSRGQGLASAPSLRHRGRALLAEGEVGVNEHA